MFNIEQLIEIDKYLLLALNGSNSLFWDGCMTVYTTTIVWIPLAIVLLYVLIKNNNINTFLLLVVIIALVFVLTDGITSTICKPLFERFRPTRDPELMYIVDVVNGYRCASYGFMSSHAANSFGIATFAMLLIKNRALSVSLAIWALLNCYSRIYLGVHYPGDILGGTVVGILTGVLMYRLYKLMCKKIRNAGSCDWISTQYTKSGYLVSDVHLLLITLYGTFTAIPIIAFFVLQQH
jgi:undecaprenyl-diphosphatase